ncbi:MAG: hypothetical protein EXS32_12800 [Opitutus sp.]|nr:hypothetical protein [Opitutus sp.]
MPSDAKLIARVETATQDWRGFVPKKMFGGMAWMLHGNMCVGIRHDSLVVRCGPADWTGHWKKITSAKWTSQGQHEGLVAHGSAGDRDARPAEDVAESFPQLCRHAAPQIAGSDLRVRGAGRLRRFPTTKIFLPFGLSELGQEDFLGRKISQTSRRGSSRRRRLGFM